MKKTKAINPICPDRSFNLDGQLISRFDEHLKRRGHTRSTRHSYLKSAKHFVSWLNTREPGTKENTKSIVQDFLYEHLPVCCCLDSGSRDVNNVRAALKQLSSMEGYEFHRNTSGDASPEIEIEIELFDEYLQKVCGHSEATRWYHRRHIRKYLSWVFENKPILVKRITSQSLCCFISEQTTGLRFSSIAVLVYSLRTYLKYLQFNGHGTPSLKAAIPKPPNWSKTSLPHALTANELKRFWAAFNCGSAIGKRDYAMARCLADLGLRCYEVAQMRLNDIDWHNSVLHLKNSKSRREESLPIQGQTAQALITYLRYGRPPTKSRFVFVYHRAPVGHSVKRTTVRGVVRRAFLRAGLPWTGTHILRSTLASRLFETGAPIKQVADILRHRSIDTTKNYTKIYFSQLAKVALPWPGRSS